jgi:hypothetical protein
MQKPETEIRAGIEWYGEWPKDDCQCARCGSSADFLRCGECGGEGCNECNDFGGAWHCISSPKWCEENPIVGRENVASTALTAEVWNDAAA